MLESSGVTLLCRLDDGRCNTLRFKGAITWGSRLCSLLLASLEHIDTSLCALLRLDSLLMLRRLVSFALQLLLRRDRLLPVLSLHGLQALMFLGVSGARLRGAGVIRASCAAASTGPIAVRRTPNHGSSFCHSSLFSVSAFVADCISLLCSRLTPSPSAPEFVAGDPASASAASRDRLARRRWVCHATTAGSWSSMEARRGPLFSPTDGSPSLASSAWTLRFMLMVRTWRLS